MKHTTYLDIIDHALLNYYKIGTKLLASGELYIKVYTPRTIESVEQEFAEKFNVKELGQCSMEPCLIENDMEQGVEFLVTFHGVNPSPPIFIGSGNHINF
jgi:hypothetical protein